MGKARILSAQGEGLYSIEILEDRTRAETARTLAAQRVAQIDARITSLESDLAAAQSEVDAAATAQDQAIAAYQAALADDEIDTAAARAEMTKAGEAVVQAAALRDAIRGNLRAAKAERLSLQTRIERIDALPPLRQIDAWCADYVEDLAGDVATAEVPGEIGQVIIKPGYTDGAAWSPSEDGAIQPALSGTPASVFYNLAMMPGWQRWRPTFRIATISNIDNDLCDISLDPATSSQQGLNVNAQSSHSGVPIMYMDCNGDAFEDGDKVLVAFSGATDQPMVVGFEREPRQCGKPMMLHIALPYSYSFPTSPRETHRAAAAATLRELKTHLGTISADIQISFYWDDTEDTPEFDVISTSRLKCNEEDLEELASYVEGYGHYSPYNANPEKGVVDAEAFFSERSSQVPKIVFYIYESGFNSTNSASNILMTGTPEAQCFAFEARSDLSAVFDLEPIDNTPQDGVPLATTATLFWALDDRVQSILAEPEE